MKTDVKIFAALLALMAALSVEARPVTGEESLLAARAWVSRDRGLTRMGVKFPSNRAAAAVAHATTNNATFYTVKMADGGTVFLAGDTDFEPVIGFTSETNDFTTIDEKSPLWALLNCEISRMKATKKPALKLTTSSATSGAASAANKNGAKWAELVSEGRSLDKPKLSTLAAAAKVNPPDDLRVPNLVKSKWSQGVAQGKACYNYYTPNGTDPAQFVPGSTDNAVCGCVATAMSQIMRYFKYPTEPREQITKTCSYEGTKMDLTTQGGTYDWDNMPLVPASGTLTEDNCKAIGKITSDAGISINMDYSPDASGATGAYAGEKFVEAFGYKNATALESTALLREGSSARTETLGKAMFCNFDAGLPVYVTIPGHAVLADGYGYDEDGVDYVHFNMGWSGSYDFWYNIPNLTVAGFNAVNFVVYNIFTNMTEDCAVISGRVTDDDGLPLAGVSVTISATATGQEAARLTTNDKGIWAAVLEDGTYDIEATDGTLIAQLSDVKLDKPYAERGFVYGLDNIGNSWGNDMMLVEPTVQIVRDAGGGVETNVFTTLDKALRAAHENDLVEILMPTTVKKPVTVVSNCTVVATNADVWASVVTPLNNALITVTNGVTLSVSNVAFNVAEAAKTVKVLDGGVLKVGGTCALEAVETADADNLVVAAGLTWHFLVDCKGAKKAGDTFATATVDPAAVCANQLLHYSNTRLGGEAFVGDHKVCIKWSAGAPVPDNAAVAKVSAGGKEWNLRAMDDAIEDVEKETEPVEITVVNNGKMTRKYALKSSSVTICGEGAEKPVLATATTAGFGIGAGTSLTLTNVTFAGTKPANDMDEISFIKVDGGNLTLADGAELNGIVGRVNDRSGVIDLNKGVVTVEDGAVIYNCSAEGVSGRGGAIYVDCEPGCTLNLRGGTITGCRSETYGGGVYVYNYSLAWSPKVNLSGPLTISGNSAGGNLKHADDLCWITANAETMPLFKVVGPVAGSVGVRFSTHIDGKPTGEAEGDAFITNAIGSAADERTLRSFFSNATAGYIAANGTGDKAGKLVWVEDSYDPRQCDESEAAAKLIDGKFVTFWREVSDALNKATDGCVVEVIAADEYVPLSSKVVVKGKDITLRSKSGAPAAKNLLRDKDVQVYIPDGSELVLTNINVVGCDLAAAEWTTNTVALFDVDGGKLDVRNSLIQYVFGNGERNANAITVYNGGTLEMSAGAQIDSCYNLTEDAASGNKANAGAGGGILVEKATAYLRDVSVIGCLGTWGGGVCADNEAKVFLSGSSSVAFNYTPDYACYSNIQLSDNSELFLDGELTDAVGVTSLEYSINRPGVTNVVAKVDTGWKWNVTSLTNSAAHFERDLDGELAVAVTNGTKALIVWCGAVKDGIYTQVEDDVTVRYALVGEMPVAPPPAALLPELLDGSAVAGALARMSDATVGAKIATLSEYNAFRDWADGVAGGKESVAESDKAYVSYQFGTTSLLEGDPTVEITEIENAEGGLKVSVIVKDGEDPVAVAAANVAKMFEATSDLGDWTKQVDFAVTDPVQNGDGSVTFTVVPEGDPSAAFIRLAY